MSVLRRPTMNDLDYHNGQVFRRYEAWDSENPWFYVMFIRFTLDLLQAGHQRVSASWIFERIRWESLTKSNVDEPFKLNNDFRAIYARRFMFDYPAYEGVFEVRDTGNDFVRELALAA